MNHNYAREKLSLLLRDLDRYNADEFWRQMSRIAGGATGRDHAEELKRRLNDEVNSHGNTVDQRDPAEEMADKLSAAIMGITGRDIGEHSSANCPWSNALEHAEEYECERDALAGHVEWARDRLTSITQYWNGAPESAVDAIEHAEHEAHMALAELPEPGAVRQSFQSRVEPWLLECFGEEIAADCQERNHRFLEEALELVQACGCTTGEAHKLVDYVFGRPVGEKRQETGGVMVTLAALCIAQGLDMHRAGEEELARITQPEMVKRIREKQKSKPAMSPLPGVYPGRHQAEEKQG